MKLGKKKGKEKMPPMPTKDETKTTKDKAKPIIKKPLPFKKPGNIFKKIFKREPKSSLHRISKEIEKVEKKKTKISKGKKDKGFKKEAKSLKKIKKKKVRQKMEHYLERAGINFDEQFISKRIFLAAVALNLLLSFYLMFYYASNVRAGAFGIIYWMILIWVFAFLGTLTLTWLSFYIYLDLRAHNRRKMIEEVFPDFLQLASANIRAGMPIDRALWFAVRPRFGILAKEMETVAKDVLSGTDLEQALDKFTRKYDSAVVRRAVTLLIEGMKSGGEIGDLLAKISINIQERQIMQKEMGADVMSYAMFIAIATILAAPFLFALSGQLLAILTEIMGGLSAGSGGEQMAQTGMSMTFSEITLKESDFKIFSIVALMISSGFSAAITATIRKGDVKEGIGQIPMYIAITVGLYLIASKGFGMLMGGFV